MDNFFHSSMKKKYYNAEVAVTKDAIFFAGVAVILVKRITIE